MNVLSRPGSIVYGLVTYGAAAGGILVSLVLSWGFAYGGTESTRYDSMAAVGFIGTFSLLVSTLGAYSDMRLFTIFTLFGASCMLVVSTPYIVATLGKPLFSPLLLVIVDVAAVILSIRKLVQIRTTR